MAVERNSVRAAGLLPRGRLGRLLGLPQRLAFTFERDKVAGVLVTFPVRRLLRGVPEQKKEMLSSSETGKTCGSDMAER